MIPRAYQARINRGIILAVAIAAGAACSSRGTHVADLEVAADAEHAQRQIIVTVYQSGSTAVRRAGTRRPYQRRAAYRASPRTDRTLNQLASEYALARVDGWLIRSLNVYCEVYEATAGAEITELIARLENDPRVKLAQRMNIFATLASGYDDPFLDLQTAVQQLEVEAAHRWATGRGVTIAVVDTGVDTRHPEIAERIVENQDFVNVDPNRHGIEMHGTAVVGVMAAVANNHLGIVGIAPEARIAALRACWRASLNGIGANCSSFTLAQAVEFAVRKRVDIINLSLAGPPDPLLSQLLTVALEKNIVIVTAAPDAADPARGFPSSHKGVIVARSVGAHATAHGERSSGLLHVSAPGTAILTTAPGERYVFLSGSSLAAAHVSGVIALLLEREPGISTTEIARLLVDTGRSGMDADSINACRALARLTESDSCATRLADSR